MLFQTLEQNTQISRIGFLYREVMIQHNCKFCKNCAVLANEGYFWCIYDEHPDTCTHFEGRCHVEVLTKTDENPRW